MQNVAKFQEVVEIPDAALKAKIHTTFRLGYIKDAALPRALDDITMAALHSMMMFNYMDILQARDRAAEASNGVEIEYYAPKEGALMWFDNMAIPVDAPNPDAAHTFLNFIMDAQNMAAASNYVYYANGNKASQEFLVEDVIGDPAIYPDDATLENLYTTSPYDPKVQRVVTRLWTKVKSGT